MTFNYREYISTPSEWFTSKLVYEGRGKAEFLNPKGRIEGPAIININESGEVSVEIIVEEYDADESLEMGLDQLLLGGRVSNIGEIKIMGDGLGRNICTSLTVYTQNGIFSALDTNIYFGFTLGSNRLRGHVYNSQFKAKGGYKVAYWIVPLLNFLSSYRYRCPELDHHPLRIYPTPTVPEDLDEEERKQATFYTNLHNFLIAFLYDNKPAFIEALPNYDEIEKDLLSGHAQMRITAIMVGETNAIPSSIKQLQWWGPLEFLRLLSLTNGNEISCSWIEFRDDQGGLVQRIHMNFQRSKFISGHTAINERDNPNCISYLLMQAQQSPNFRKSYTRAVIKNLVISGLEGPTIEDKLSSLFRAIDCLIQEFHLNEEAKAKQHLSPQIKTNVESITAEAAQAVRALKKGSKNSEEKEALDRIANQLFQAKEARVGYGKAVLALLKQFDFPDAEVVSSYYAIKPRADKRNWIDVLSYYRGIVIHNSYFNFSEEEQEMRDAVRVIYHLHDILIRMVLKLLNYEAPYQPIMAKYVGYSVQPDWVKLDTPAHELGY